MTRSLFVATEEGASPGLASAVQVVSDSLELGVSVGESFRFIPCEDIPGINFELIPREYGPKTDRIICMVVQPSARGSFVDAIFYHQALFPSPADNPIAAVEITKNDLKESGNMSDQRAAKFAPLSFVKRVLGGLRLEQTCLSWEAILMTLTLGGSPRSSSLSMRLASPERWRSLSTIFRKSWHKNVF